MTFYSLPDGSPLGITTGPDGALWAVQSTSQPCPYNSHIAQVTTAGSVTEYSLGFCDATYPITGPDGALWITNQGGFGYPLGRFTTGSGGFTDFGTNQPTVGFYGLTTGSDGAIWIAAGNEIVRSDTNGVMINYTIPANQDPATYNIAAGPDGALWFTEGRAGVDKIGRITTSGTFADYQIPTSGGYAFGITPGPDGAMWFTEHDGDKVGRIDMYGNISEFPLPSGSGAYGIAAGPDGNLWIAENSSNAIAKMTTGGYVTEYPLPSSCSYSCSPFQITAGPDGAMWFTLMSCPSNCYPSTPGLVGRIATDGSPKRRTRQDHMERLPAPGLRTSGLLGLGAAQ